MLTTQHTQSLTDFRQKATETLERLNQTGEAEILTVNGHAKAVLLSPAAFDELAREVQLAREAHLARDVSVIRQAMQEIDTGKGQEAGRFFKELRSELKASKSSRKGKRR